jgi:hypothetical protein
MGKQAASQQLLSSPELWSGFAAGAGASLAAVAVTSRDPRSAIRSFDSGVLLAAGLLIGLLVTGRSSLGAIVAVAVGLAASRRLSALAAPRGWAVVSMGCAFAVYSCVPDTEGALTVLGVTAGVGLVTEATRRPWAPGAVVCTIAMVWVALTDGRPRASAVVGALAIAGLHALSLCIVRRGPATRSTALAAAVVIAAAGWCGRVAGLADSGATAVVLTVPALALVAVLAAMGLRAAAVTDPR